LKTLPTIILASKSPRRQELLRLMDVDFRIVLKDVDESYPANLSPEEIAVYIAEKKARAFDESVDDQIVLTADTIVSIDGHILGKPESTAHAAEMLHMLSGKVHKVITGVCILYQHKYNLFHDVSEVFSVSSLLMRSIRMWRNINPWIRQVLMVYKNGLALLVSIGSTAHTPMWLDCLQKNYTSN
jgi:MAF protein